jgi:hypothetical protein
MLGQRFAVEAARNRTNGCTYDGADRAKTDSNRVCTRRANNRVEIRPSLSRGVIVHVVLRCPLKEESNGIGESGYRLYGAART